MYQSSKIRFRFIYTIWFTLVIAILFLVLFWLLGYPAHFENIDYAQVSQIVQLIVETDVSMIAFTGIIANVILTHFIRKEELSDMAVICGSKKKEKKVKIIHIRDKLINFITFTIFLFFCSILISFYAITVKSFVGIYLIFSLTFLLTGFVELIVSIYFSLHPST